LHKDFKGNPKRAERFFDRVGRSILRSTKNGRESRFQHGLFLLLNLFKNLLKYFKSVQKILMFKNIEHAVDNEQISNMH